MIEFIADPVEEAALENCDFGRSDFFAARIGIISEEELSDISESPVVLMVFATPVLRCLRLTQRRQIVFASCSPVYRRAS